jgi:integrase
MNTVQPITDIIKIRAMEEELKKVNYRDYLMFKVGIHSGYRISDIIKLKVSDLKGKTYFETKENKTGKNRKIVIHPELKKELDEYLKDKNDNEYIFGSKKYLNIVKTKTRIKNEKTNKMNTEYIDIENESPNSPITRQQAYRILNNAARKVGITEEIGTHTMRKIFGYFLYMNSIDKNGNKDISLVQEILNHSTPDVTLRYIGITQNKIDDLICALNY